jgi:phosphoribosyl 1,2-cyclic phosphodiesterase
MKIKIWGCRGSIATPGADTIRYGGNSTCVEIRSAEGQLFVVDAGSGIRNLGKALQRESKISEIRFFFTHSHWDHLVGFPFFEPAYSDRFTITFCSGAHAESSIKRYVSRQMEAPYFPVEFRQLRARFNFCCENPTMESRNCPLGSMQCCAFRLSHPNGGHGYKFIEGGKTLVFLPDNELRFRHDDGLTRDQYVEICRGADLLLHDAQYTEEEYQRTRGWGHSTYMDAVDLAIEAGVKRLGLFHHDPDRTDDDLDRQLDLCRKHIVKSGSAVDCFICAEGMVIELPPT